MKGHHSCVQITKRFLFSFSFHETHINFINKLLSMAINFYAAVLLLNTSGYVSGWASNPTPDLGYFFSTQKLWKGYELI